jgi:hypothetical protein
MADSKLTPDVRSKIEEAASLDCSVREMAYYADVSHQTIYNWLDPKSDFFDGKLAERVEKLRERPILKARQTIVKSLDTPQFALEYLQRKRKKEFGDSQDITSGGEAIAPVLVKFIDENDTNTNGV